MAVQEHYKEWLRPSHYILRFFIFLLIIGIFIALLVIFLSLNCHCYRTKLSNIRKKVLWTNGNNEPANNLHNYRNQRVSILSINICFTSIR